MFKGESGSKAVGDAAEARALAFLQRQGLALVQRNYRVARGPRSRGGEIDLGFVGGLDPQHLHGHAVGLVVATFPAQQEGRLADDAQAEILGERQDVGERDRLARMELAQCEAMRRHAGPSSDLPVSVIWIPGRSLASGWRRQTRGPGCTEGRDLSSSWPDPPGLAAGRRRGSGQAAVP